MSIRKHVMVAMVAASFGAILFGQREATAQSPAGASGRGAAVFTKRNMFGVSCGNSMAECKAFCSAACDILPSGGANCPRVPTSGEGLIAKDSSQLMSIAKALPNLKYVKVAAGAKATQEVVDGLKRLDGWLATSPDRAKYNYSIQVNNCWRDGVYDSKVECYFIMKDKNPQDLKLAWPGATPHSSGKACDLVLVDQAGKVATPSTACTADAKTSSGVDFKTASKLLDEALTNDVVGAQRLNYEAWHFEWGGAVRADDCRCKAPECQEKFWPPSCTPAGCRAH